MENKQQTKIPFQAQPEVIRGIYTNNMQVSHTNEEFVLDFMHISHTPSVISLVSKIITNPTHFKRMVAALNDNLKRYEAKFGKIEGGKINQPAAASSTSEIGFKS